eukprot:8792693-Pyramimonas_sp.AAC.1
MFGEPLRDQNPGTCSTCRSAIGGPNQNRSYPHREGKVSPCSAHLMSWQGSKRLWSSFLPGLGCTKPAVATNPEGCLLIGPSLTARIVRTILRSDGLHRLHACCYCRYVMVDGA